ncbi:MAG: iron-sulfur cluster assembly accessory protein [Alphaproteobacteria bacterium]|nr:iron-sulfur cluster assembly accessory protein [Alphaproteobacteria bacterium]
MMLLSIMPQAAKRINDLLQSDPELYALRIAVEGGGCSGFSYKYELVHEKAADDQVIEQEGARVVIDPVSTPFLLGSSLDFVDSLLEQSFVIKNPNAASSCGCGVSFSI